MRAHLFEFEDLPWFPDTIRKGMTDYLRYVLGSLLHHYKPVAPVLADALRKTDSSRIIDLASGGGGAAVQLLKDLRNEGIALPIVFTDRFPNVHAYELLKNELQGMADYVASPVEASAVPKELTGFRVMFSAFHHLRPAEAKAVLRDAAMAGEGIAIFDGGDKNILTMLAIAFVHPLLFAVLTPFFRPFGFSRLLFTYVVPLIPLCTIWDGLVSILRLYRVKDLLSLAHDTGAENYTWKAGRVKNDTGMHVNYLVGYPEKNK